MKFAYNNKVYVEVDVWQMFGTCSQTYTQSQALIYKGFHEGIGICWAETEQIHDSRKSQKRHFMETF